MAENNTLFREGLLAMLGGTTDLHVVGQAGDGVETVRVIDKTRPDLLLMNLALPKMSGLTVIRRIKEGIHRPKILLFRGASAIS